MPFIHGERAFIQKRVTHIASATAGYQLPRKIIIGTEIKLIANRERVARIQLNLRNSMVELKSSLRRLFVIQFEKRFNEREFVDYIVIFLIGRKVSPDIFCVI